MPQPIVIGAHPKRDDRAPLELGVMLARLTGAPLHVVSTYWFDSTPRRTAVDEYADGLRRKLGHVIEDAVGEAALDAPVEVHVSCGAPAHALHEKAAELDAALIVVGSTHRGTLGRIAAGTTAGHVLSGAPCPVMMAPRGHRATRTLIGKVGVAFVDTPGGWSALAAGAAIARRTEAALVAYTVTESDTDTGDRRRAEAAVEQAVAGSARDIECEARLLGNGVDGLIQETRGLDFLIRGCASEGRFRRPLAREVPNKLAGGAACPIVIVQPGREERLVELFDGQDSRHEAALLT